VAAGGRFTLKVPWENLLQALQAAEKRQPFVTFNRIN
jgi:hypothetical protein